MKKLTTMVAVALAPMAFAYGQDASVTAEPVSAANAERPALQEIRDKVRENRAEIKETAQEVRKDFREGVAEIKDKRKEFITDSKEIRSDFKEETQERRDELKAELDAAETEEEKQAIREQAKTERDAAREQAKELRDERFGKAQEHIKQRGTLVLNRLQAVLDRGAQIYDRMTNALSDLSDQGVDVSGARSAMTIALGHQNTSAGHIADATASLRVATDTDDTEEARAALGKAKASFKAAKASLQDMFASLREAHKALKEAVRVFKAENSETEAQ